MKLAIVTSTFPPYRGGMGDVAEEEARLLSERSHDVTVFVPEYKAVDRTEQKYKVQYVKPLFAVGNAAVIPGIMRALNGFDAVHLHYPFFGGAEYLALKKFLSRFKKEKFEFVMTYHMDVVGSGLKSWIFKIYSRFVFPFIARAAKKIIVSSHDYAASSPILKRNWRVVEPKLVEVPFPQAPAATNLQSANKEKFFILIASLDRAHYFKGVDKLLHAFALAKPRLEDYKLRIVGDGEMRKDYEALATKLGIQNDVEFLGSLPPGPEFAAKLKGARALVSPSIDRSEAFGLVLLRALSHGVPLIASNLSGVRTVATPDVAIRIAPGDITALATALNMLANDDTLHAKLTQAIPEKLKKYHPETYAQKKIDIFRS